MLLRYYKLYLLLPTLSSIVPFFLTLFSSFSVLPSLYNHSSTHNNFIQTISVITKVECALLVILLNALVLSSVDLFVQIQPLYRHTHIYTYMHIHIHMFPKQFEYFRKKENTIEKNCGSHESKVLETSLMLFFFSFFCPCKI